MSSLEEIIETEKIADVLKGTARLETLAQSSGPEKWPIYKISFGTDDPKAPVLGLVGGVHGLERIGARVCVSLLKTLSQLLQWDKNTQRLLEDMRIFFIPTVNPWGIYHKRRSNANGVDLMRNAPIDGEGKITPLVGGHRHSPILPWYRGPLNGPLEPESQAVISAIQKEMDQCPLMVTVDFHSGFGLRDRLWFPYAKSTKPYPEIALMHSFKELLDTTYPHHIYKIEPQALNYTTHGDLWDYLYDWQRERKPDMRYLPLCIEMGSWSWVKKNPLQFFSKDGAFNPIIAHRMQRTLRRHNLFFEFLLRSVSSYEAWASLSPEQQHKHEIRARSLWYEENKK